VHRHAPLAALTGSAIWIVTMGAATMADPSNTRRANATASYWLWYYTRESDQEKNGIVIDGEAIQSEIQIAEPGRRPRGLGWYALTASSGDPDLAAVGRIIREQRLVGGEVHAQPTRFGMRSKVFSIRMNGQEARHDLDPNQPLPPGLRQLESALVPFWNRLDQSPLRTLELRIELSPEHVRAGDTVRLGLHFTNRGRFAAQFRNPAAFAKNGPNSLRIHFYRLARGAGGEETEEFAWELDVVGHELLVAERKALPSGEPLLSIAPAETLRAWTTFRAPALPPGNYSAQGSFYTAPVGPKEREAHNDLVAGDFRTDIAALVVDES
jgi:hypothetical protein